MHCARSLNLRLFQWIVKAPKQRTEKICLAEKLGTAVETDRRLEAISVDPGAHEVRIATLGEDTDGEIGRRVESLLQPGPEACGLLSGECEDCDERTRLRDGTGRIAFRAGSKGETVIEKKTCVTAHSLWKWRNLKWPRMVPREAPALHIPEDEREDAPEDWRPLAAFSFVCLVALVAGWAATSLGLPLWVAWVCYAVAYVAGGWDAAVESFSRLRRGEVDVHFLMLAVACGAAAIGAFAEGALLLFLFSASGAMEHFAQGRTRQEIGALLKGAPETACVIGEDGKEERCPVEAIPPGTRVRVTSGEQAPLDIEVLQGESEFDESMLTGESRPVSKRPGDHVLAGTLNLWGVVEGHVLRTSKESAVQKMVRLIREAGSLKAPSQRFTDRFGTGYTYAVLGFCVLMFFVWWSSGAPAFYAESGEPSAFYRAMTLLVVCSPCALVLSVPSAILSAIASAARRGVLFRGGAAVETLAGVRAVAFDKTGTLTEGEMALKRVEAIAASEDEVMRYAAMIARYSQHPLSRAVWRSALARGMAAPPGVERIVTETGEGVRAELAGGTLALGKESFVRRSVPGLPQAQVAPLECDETQVWVGAQTLDGNRLLGQLVFQDQIRPDAAALLTRLKERDLHLAMLTGDQPAAAFHLARGLPIDDVRAGLSPKDKVTAILEMKDHHGRVAMIGDGVNDAASLAAADVGVAMGARGSDAALEQSEVVLLKDRIENFLLAYEISRRSRHVIWQNVAISLSTVLFMTATIILFGAPLGLSVLAHEGSTVLVVLNSLRLLFLNARETLTP